MLLFNGLESYGLLVLRIFLGIVFIYHAMPKLKSPGGMAKSMKWSKGTVVLLGLVEILAALALILGFYAEIGALAVAVVMLGAIYHKLFTWKIPFSGSNTTGWEFDTMLLVSAVVILLLGAGAISLDAMTGIWP